MNTDLYEAFQHIWRDPRNGEYRVKLGEEDQFRRPVSVAARNFGLDREKYRVTNGGLFQKFRDILIEIAEEQGTDVDRVEFNRLFETKKGEIFSEWLAQPPDDYTVVFPIMIRSRNFPDSFELYESRAEQIDFDTWNDHYLTVAESSDESNFDSFLEEIPNEFSDDYLSRREWSYYTVEIPARDEFFAISQMVNHVELRLAEINFFDNLWSAGIPQPASSDRPPNEKWSRLQVPPFYLLFEGRDFVSYRGIDYDYRRSAGILHFHASDVDEINEIPTFNYNAEANSYEGHIVSALLAYQDGITERSVRQSFFSFWRGVEILSQTSNYGKMVDRGEFSVSYHRGPDTTLRPDLQEALEELVDVRHQLVHEGLQTEVQRRHQNGAKILLDGLLLIYIENLGEWYLDDVASFLKYGTQYKDKLRFVSRIMNKISSFNTS